MTVSYKKILLLLPLVLALLPGGALHAGSLGNIEIKNKSESRKKAGIGPVIYPHTFHEKLFKCADCHPKIFVDKRGANEIDMNKNMTGKYCGSPNCHNSTKAFPLWQCAKCHTDVTGG